MTMNATPSFFNKYVYYALIFCLSLICLFFFPFLGTEIGLAFVLPTTAAGWVVWVVTNLSSSLLNVLMFHFFIKQGKLNISQHPAYLKANELLCVHNIGTVELPQAPKVWLRRQYRNKGISLFLFSVLGVITFGQAILVFDAVKFLSQLITLIIGIVCGIMEMKSVEDYWTIEYPEYAKLEVQKLDKEKQSE